MGLLKTEPEGSVESLPELMAIAKAMEDEAAARYRQLGRYMQAIGNQPAKDVFDHLALEEDAHAIKVEEMSRAVIGSAPERRDIRWDLPKDLEDEGMSDLAVSRLVTPYRALSVAVHNEERAFAFWSYVSAYAPSSEIRRYAEVMAREELRHASILRKERRRAYRNEAPRPAPRSSQDAAASSLERLQKTAAFHEKGIVEKCQMLARAADVRGDEPTARVLTRIADESGANLQALGRAGGRKFLQARPDYSTSVEILDGAIALIESAAESYLEFADGASDESAVAAAQRLTESAITRLVSLRERRGELSPVEFEGAPASDDGAQ